jgi:uncharacterized membrane protein YgdD (TMEM256/DUF423 family)
MTSLRLAGLIGGLAVLLGAFGAHALEGRLSPEALEIWTTSNRYHFYHSLAFLVTAFAQAAGFEKTRAPLILWGVGLMIFSGGLYCYALLGIKFFALIAPIGGLALVAGWVSIWRVAKPD